MVGGRNRKAQEVKISFLDAASLGPGLDLQRFSAWGELEIWDSTVKEETLGRLAGTVVAVANRVAFDETLFSACPALRLVLLAATGFNQIDLGAARRYGVAVCNVVGYSTASVAQHTLALVLALMEQTAWLDHYAKNLWAGSHSFDQFGRPFHEIAGKTWGIIGLGNIGARVAGLAKAFGASVCYFSSSNADRSSEFPRLGLEELLRRCDILSIHSPLNEKTRGLLGARELQWMKPSAYLVNTGRGGIVDETSLAHALEEGVIAGAALDVTLPEPPLPENPLLALAHPERLILSPHVAWASVESRSRCLDEVELNLRAWLKGERRNRVD